MIADHKSFETPTDAAALWRYMDAGQFLSLISTSKLHFTRVDQFEDKWEGEVPEPHKDAIKQAVTLKQIKAELADTLTRFPRVLKTGMFVNCWHENEYESAAMWKLYGQHNTNIAVLTTMRNIRRSMAKNECPTVHCGRVRYIDYHKDQFNSSNVFSYYIHKRKSFSHEREVRLVIMDIPLDGNVLKIEEQRLKGGIDVPIELEELIVKVLVSPKAPDWYVSALRDVSAKFGVRREIVTRSNLDDAPII